MMQPSPGSQVLRQHINGALSATARQLATQYPHRRDEISDWLDTAHQNLAVSIETDTYCGADTRSAHVHIMAEAIDGLAPLVTVFIPDIDEPEWANWLAHLQGLSASPNERKNS